MKFSDFTPWAGSQSQEILSMNSSKGFSMVFVLVPASMPTDLMLTGVQFEEMSIGLSRIPQLADLLDTNHRAGRIKLWENWDMVIIVSSFLSRILSPIPEQIKPAFRSFNYKNVSAGLTDLMTQAVIKSNK
jgi:hypothetical protein